MPNRRGTTEADMQAWEQYTTQLTGEYVEKINTMYHANDPTAESLLPVHLTDFGEKLLGKNHELLGSKIPSTSGFMGRLATAVSVLRGEYNA